MGAPALVSGLALPLHSESSRGAASSRKSCEQQPGIQTGHTAGRCSKSSKPQFPRRGRRQETRRVFQQAGHFTRSCSDRKLLRRFQQVSRWPYLLVVCSPLWSWLWFQHTGPLSQRTDDCHRLHETLQTRADLSCCSETRMPLRLHGVRFGRSSSASSPRRSLVSDQSGYILGEASPILSRRLRIPAWHQRRARTGERMCRVSGLYPSSVPTTTPRRRRRH